MNKFDNEVKALEYYVDALNDHGTHNTLFLEDLPKSECITSTVHANWPNADCKAKSFS